MLFSIDADVTGAHRMLEDIGDRLDSPLVVLAQMADDLADYEREVFATQGFGTWAGADLVDTGALMKMLTGTPNLDLGDDAVEAVAPEYAGFLRAGARGAPRRDPAPVPPEYVQEQWAEHVLDALVGGVL